MFWLLVVSTVSVLLPTFLKVYSVGQNAALGSVPVKTSAGCVADQDPVDRRTRERGGLPFDRDRNLAVDQLDSGRARHVDARLVEEAGQPHLAQGRVHGGCARA